MPGCEGVIVGGRTGGDLRGSAGRLDGVWRGLNGVWSGAGAGARVRATKPRAQPNPNPTTQPRPQIDLWAPEGKDACAGRIKLPPGHYNGETQFVPRWGVGVGEGGAERGRREPAACSRPRRPRRPVSFDCTKRY
jgi:hypothetical protein